MAGLKRAALSVAMYSAVRRRLLPSWPMVARPRMLRPDSRGTGASPA